MTSRESTTLISPTHTLEADRVYLPLQMLSTSPVIIAQMMTICNIDECSLFAYDTFMVKLVNACLPLLFCNPFRHFQQVSRYVSYRDPSIAIRIVSWGYRIVTPLAHYSIYLPAIFGRYTLLVFFCRLNIVPLDRDNGIFNSSNTDVVEKVNLLVAVSQHGGTSVAEGSP